MTAIRGARMFASGSTSRDLDGAASDFARELREKVNESWGVAGRSSMPETTGDLVEALAKVAWLAGWDAGRAHMVEQATGACACSSCLSVKRHMGTEVLH